MSTTCFDGMCIYLVSVLTNAAVTYSGNISSSIHSVQVPRVYLAPVSINAAVLEAHFWRNVYRYNSSSVKTILLPRVEVEGGGYVCSGVVVGDVQIIIY